MRKVGPMTSRISGQTAAGRSTEAVPISEDEFLLFQKLIYQAAGINLSPAKKALVCGRLSSRLRQRAINSYAEYYRLLVSGEESAEMQIAIDLLTTNETQFFREPKHFDFLRQHIAASVKPGCAYRVWSAACSTGEEPYSIAMVLADCLGDGPWEIVASDISTRVLDKARIGHYPQARAQNIPRHYLMSYCLKGIERQKGTFLIDKALRARVQFMQINLNESLPRIGEFNVIFLRNVMIYFAMETKQLVVRRMLPVLKPGGCFIIGHSESLNGVVGELDLVAPSIYKNPQP